MAGLYGILDLAKGALLTHQKAMDVTAHNVANASTEGYSRQRLNMETKEPLWFNPGQLGTGVRGEEIQRIHDRFMSLKINQGGHFLGRWEAQKGALEKGEMVFNESSGPGLNQAMNEFWTAWQDLANNPSSREARRALLSKGEVVTDTIGRIYAELERVKDDVDKRIEGGVEEINRLSAEIADLNMEIAGIEYSGQNANDLRDDRDRLLKQMSSLIDINSFEQDDGKVTVMTSGGRPLVERGSSWDLGADTGSAGVEDIEWIDTDGSRVVITDTILGGKMKGWFEAKDVIDGYLNKVDSLAGSLITEVNSLHSNGYGLGGSTGEDFFNGSSALDIMVNPVLLGDPDMIAASSTAAGVPGDNSNALAVSGLEDALTMGGGTVTFNEFYASLVAEVGSDVQAAKGNFKHQSEVMNQLESYRESISGVSLDEEMVNLMKFQQSYAAAAKLISRTDELLTGLINMV